MKRKLLLFASFALFALNSNAQSRIYFTECTATPAAPSAGTASWATTNGAFAATTSTTPWSPFDNVAYPNCYTTNSTTGSGTLNFSTALPLISNGAFKGKIIVHWGTISNRVLNLSINGGALVQIDAVTVSGDRNKVRTASYDIPTSTADITSIRFVSSGGGGVSGFDLEVQTYGSLATDSFKADSSATVYAAGNQVFVSNVQSNTTVAVYSVAGALVKTVETSSDTSFDLASGVYVAKVKSAEGEKSVKLLVK